MRDTGILCLVIAGGLGLCACSQDKSGAGGTRGYQVTPTGNGIIANGTFRVLAPDGTYSITSTIEMKMASRAGYDEIVATAYDGLASLRNSAVEEEALGQIGFGDSSLILKADTDNNSVDFGTKRYYLDTDLDEFKGALLEGGLGNLGLHLQGSGKIVVEDAASMMEDAAISDLTNGSRKPVGRFFKKLFEFVFSHVDASCTWSTDGSKSSRSCKVGTH